jgi:hypothetical protein
MKFEVIKKDKIGITMAIMDLVDIHTHKEPVFNPDTGITYTKNYIVFKFKNPLEDKLNIVNFQIPIEKECNELVIVNIWKNMKDAIYNSNYEDTVLINLECLENIVKKCTKDGE